MTEWARGHSGEDRHASAAGLDFAGRGGFKGDAEIMPPARSGESGGECGIQRGFALAQQFPRMGEREALQEILRRGSGPGGEKPVEMLTD